MLKTSTGQTININGAKELAAGGEGRIIEHPDDSRMVIKVYHQPRKAGFEKHLQHLSNLPEEFIKPQDIFFTPGKTVAGYSMFYVDFNRYFLFNNLFNKGFCNSQGFDFDFKKRVLKKVCESVQEVHKLGIVVGDMNQYNLFFSASGEIKFVDVDSYGSQYCAHSNVLLDDIRDWTTLDINEGTDKWAFDILVFWAITFCHPYKWVIPGDTNSLQQRVLAKKHFLSIILGIKIPPLYVPPPAELAKQFLEIFDGRRYFVKLDGSYAAAPTVITAPPKIHDAGTVSIRELYTGVTQVNACSKFIGARIKGQWQLLRSDMAGQVSSLQVVDCDALYPADSNYAFVKNGKLFGSAFGTGHSWDFDQPVYHYDNGSLSIFEYGHNVDTMWSIDISGQLGNTFNIRRTNVFVKSIMVRDVPMQNFGSKKYIKIANGNSFRMIEVPQGTQNAFYCNGFVAVEYREKNAIKYMLVSERKVHASEPHAILDYLPWFSVKTVPRAAASLFVPDDGCINIYQEFQKVVEVKVPMCTKSSKLWATYAGTIMLENNTLYLITSK